MRGSRLLTILIILQLRGRASAAALARELEVSVRTIYRDVDELGAAGVPVYAERGRNGGFALVDGYRTNLTGLTAPEADAVPLIGLVQAAADLGLGDGAAAARRKVLASVPPGRGRLADAVATRFHLDPAPWYSRRPAPPALRGVAEAVWAGHRLRLDYESWKGAGPRTVSPLGLVMKGGTWYLVAASPDVPRIYRVAAIRRFEATADPVKRPARFDLAAFWSRAVRDFESRIHGETVRVRLSPRGLRLLRDVNPLAAEAVDAQRPRPGPDGWLEARVPFEAPPHGVHEALRMGAQMEVLEPATLRDAVAAEARRVARAHRGRRRGGP